MPRAEPPEPAALGRSISPAIGGIDAPPAPFVPPERHGAPVVVTILVGFGTAEEHATAVATVRAALDPLFEMATTCATPAAAPA